MEFKWINESKIEKDGHKIKIYAPDNTDFFCGNGSELDPESLCNAPFYYTEIEGDFVLRVKVSHDFLYTYDSCSIMVMKDMTNWAKACFELTDFGTHAAVSVVTKGVSDDANGCNIEGNVAWLQMCRRGDTYGFHYSLDGENFYMTRFFYFDPGKVKIGLLAQAPTGKGSYRTYEDLTIEKRTVENVRAGK